VTVEDLLPQVQRTWPDKR